MRADLPSGTVTLLFTDIESSTRLLHALGPESYSAALLEHRASLRHTFAEAGGVDVDTQGDAFFVAALESGRSLSLGQATAVALGETQTSP